MTVCVERILELSDEEVLVDSPDISEIDEDDEDNEDNEDDEDDEEVDESSTRPKQHKARILDSEASTDSEEKEEGEEEFGGWGSSKRDYYNADNIETEADALEEETEARRLQQKQLQALTEEDFGFDEVKWAEAGRDANGVVESGRENVVQEILPELEITDAMGPEERLKIMRMRYPEFEPLAKEFVQLQTIHEDLRLAVEATLAVYHRLQTKIDSTNLASDPEKIPIVVVKSNALSSYLAALCLYFALLTSKAKAGDANGKITAMSAVDLRSHAVMEALVQCRELWNKVKDVPIPDPSSVVNGSASLSNENVGPESDPGQKDAIALADKNNGIYKDKQKKPRMSKAQKAALTAQAEEKARHDERIKKTEEDLLSLSALTASLKTSRRHRSRSRSRSPSSNSSFGEQTTLTPKDALEKAKSKKSLRFYTSQIAQKSQKRGAAGRNAGGDDDIPHRERLRDRQERLNAAAEKRGTQKPTRSGNDTLGGDSDEEDHKAATALRATDPDEAYYDLITTQTTQKKARKSAPPSTTTHPSPPSPSSTPTNPTTKRPLSHAISKNKGLAPSRRNKDVRNPRVKKRKQFERKMKKLGSMRPVFRGGEGKGGYAGERTGIRTGLSRGVRF